MQGVQGQEAAVHQAHQALRVGREEEGYWRILNALRRVYSPCLTILFVSCRSECG